MGKKNPTSFLLDMQVMYLFLCLKRLPSFVVTPVFICIPQSVKETLRLLLALSSYDSAAKAVCCEGVCASFPSISWIYSSKSKAFYTSLSFLSAHVLLRRKNSVAVCASVSLSAAGFYVPLEAERSRSRLICDD